MGQYHFGVSAPLILEPSVVGIGATGFPMAIWRAWRRGFAAMADAKVWPSRSEAAEGAPLRPKASRGWRTGAQAHDLRPSVLVRVFGWAVFPGFSWRFKGVNNHQGKRLGLP